MICTPCSPRARLVAMSSAAIALASSHAAAARDNDVPMYADVPSTTIDWTLASGDDVPIEERDAAEVLNPGGEPIAPAGTVVVNPAFDVTPGRLFTGLITERGVCAASKAGLSGLFPEHVHE